MARAHELSKYFEEVFTFLQEYSWIHQPHMTKFCERQIWENIPEEWSRVFSALTIEEMNSLPFHQVNTDPAEAFFNLHLLPCSLAEFLQKSSVLSPCRLQARHRLPNATKVSRELSKGMSPKKLHEVEWMASLVHQVALEAGCNIVVDVGSGLGYLGQVLHQNYGLSVIGLEGSAGHSEGADRRTAKQGLGCSGVKTIPFHISGDDDNIQQFCDLIHKEAASFKPCQHSLLLHRPSQPPSTADLDLKAGAQPCQCSSSVHSHYPQSTPAVLSHAENIPASFNCSCDDDVSGSGDVSRNHDRHKSCTRDVTLNESRSNLCLGKNRFTNELTSSGETRSKVSLDSSHCRFSNQRLGSTDCDGPGFTKDLESKGVQLGRTLIDSGVCPAAASSKPELARTSAESGVDGNNHDDCLRSWKHAESKKGLPNSRLCSLPQSSNQCLMSSDGRASDSKCVCSLHNPSKELGTRPCTAQADFKEDSSIQISGETCRKTLSLSDETVSVEKVQGGISHVQVSEETIPGTCSAEKAETGVSDFQVSKETGLQTISADREGGVVEAEIPKGTWVQGKNLGAASDVRVCLIGLHCCGDLTPTMLQLYDKVTFLRALCCVSCCYHKMQHEPGSDQFFNFPMSAAAQAAFTALCGRGKTTSPLSTSPSPSAEGAVTVAAAPLLPPPAAATSISAESFLTPCSLRLAAQETRTRWTSQSAADHDRHTRHVGYRALLEVFFQEVEGSSLKRNVLRRLDFTSFDCFVESYIKSAKITDGEQQTVRNNLRSLHHRLQPSFSLIESYTCLQVVLQPVLEWLVLQDRQQWLAERSWTSELLPVFDEDVSPRNVALVSSKRPLLCDP